MTRRSLALALAAALVTIAVAFPVSAGTRGDANDSDVGNLLYKIKVLAVAPGHVPDRPCTNRIYFEQGNGSTLGTLRWQFEPASSPSFQIQDCGGIDQFAAIRATESEQYYVMVLLRGQNSLSVVCQDALDVIGVDDLCLEGSAVSPFPGFTKKITANVPDGVYEEALWVVFGDWQSFEILIYEKLG